jgi:hypothetical protein
MASHASRITHHISRIAHRASRIPYPSLFPVVGGILALLVYLGIAWFVLPPHGFWTSDEGAKLLQLQNLRWQDGRLAYDIAYPGREVDPDLHFAQNDPLWGSLRVLDGRLYLQRFPVFPLLALPLFRWFGFYGLYLLPAVGGAVSGVLALQLLDPGDRRFGMWMLIAFGSPVFIYATIFWEHTLATCLGLAAAWIAFRVGPVARPIAPRQVCGWVAAGAILGISAYIRLEMLIFGLALLFAYWWVVRDGRWGPLWAGVSLGLVMLPYRPLHGMMFGGQQMPQHTANLFYPFYYLVRAQWRAVPDVLIGPYAESSIDAGWLGGLGAIAAVIAVAHSFSAIDSPAMRAVRLAGLAITAITGAIFLFNNTLYHSGHGLLFTTPWALLGLVRAREVWQRGNWRARVILLSVVLGLIGYTLEVIGFRSSGPHGGLEWGARFAMPFYPPLALIAAWDLGAKRRDVKTLVLVGALMFLGLGFQVRGIWTIRHDKQVNVDLNRMIVAVSERHVVSDERWVPLTAAPIYTEREIFVADTPEELGSWVGLAAARQVQRFSLLTANDAFLDETNQILDRHRLSVVDAHRLRSLSIYRVAIGSK